MKSSVGIGIDILIVNAFFHLHVLSWYRWCLLPLLSRTDEDVEVANAEKVDEGEDQNDVRIDVLCASEPIRVVQEGTKDWTDELTQTSACNEHTANVIVKLFDIVVAIVTRLDRF